MEGLVQVPSREGRIRRLPAAPSLRLAVLVALPTVAVLLTLLHYELTTVWWLADGDRMARFEAAAPFQYRVLLPALVAVVHAVSALEVATLFAFTEVMAWVLLVVVAERGLRSFEIASDAFARWALALTVTIPVAAHLIPPDLLARALLVVEDGVLSVGEWQVTWVFRYVYDLPAAVFTLALVVALHRLVATREQRWLVIYLGLFVLAVLNRETAVFLVPVFLAVCYRVLDHRTLLGALLFQAVVVVGIQVTLQALFADNVNPHANVAGTQYENHLLRNLALLAGPAYLAVFLLRFGAGMWVPVLAFSRHLDPFLARALLWFGIPFLITSLVFGRIQEHRVMVEMAPLIWLGGVQALTAYRSCRRASPRSDIRPRSSVRTTAAQAVLPGREP